MGQTLTHGIYLPDEGERNCYNGLASNWSILDGAVGTIAAHTAALAGKAPLVHTHTKSNITDLFNSANTWTGDNTFSGNNSFNSGLTINNAALLNAVLQNAVKGDVSTTGDFAIFIKDKVNGNAATSLLAVYRGGQDSGGSYAQINIDTKGNANTRYNNSILFRINPADNSNNAILIPQRDSTIDLGTSTSKWKTFNGLNPGALSLPDSASFVDISGSITNLDGTDNFYTPSVNGWISVCVGNNSPSLSMYCDRNNSWGASFAPTNTNTIFGILPLVAGNRVRIRTVCGALIYARFYPCLGNV